MGSWLGWVLLIRCVFVLKCDLCAVDSLCLPNLILPVFAYCGLMLFLDLITWVCGFAGFVSIQGLVLLECFGWCLWMDDALQIW